MDDIYTLLTIKAVTLNPFTFSRKLHWAVLPVIKIPSMPGIFKWKLFMYIKLFIYIILESTMDPIFVNSIASASGV